MEARTRQGRLLQDRLAQQPLGFRSTKNARSGPGDGKEPRVTKQSKDQQTWPPAHGTKPSETRLKEKLPEKLLLLEELYHSMEAAISLLRIRHNICTFSTIGAAVESSTQRRFLRNHLAQMKYILPDALHVEEYISWDAESQCSRRDLRITLLPVLNEEGGSVQRYKSPQKSTDMVVRRREFHRRLLEFHHKNKEVDVDVPQASMFGGVAAFRHDVCKAELLEPSPTHVEGVQEEEKVSTTDEQAKCFHEDCVEVTDMESPSLPAFNVAQLKKFPRSPSKLSQQHRVSPAPPHTPMSHLPAIFKPHFSAKRPTDLADSGNTKLSEKASELVSLPGSVASMRPHFSLKRCKKVAVSPVPSTPQKAPIQSAAPNGLADCPAASSPALAATLQTSSLMSPPAERSRITISEPTCRTPAQSVGSVLYTSFTSPPIVAPAFTPQQAILTPSATTTPSVGVPNKEAGDVPVKRRKQAVMKSLRFGTPTKHAGLDTTGPAMEATACTFLSPVKTPINDTFIVTKKPSGNVSRVLPFNSPAGGKKKEGPKFTSHEDQMHTPKRVKLSCRQLLELEPCNSKQDLRDVGNARLLAETPEMAAGAEQSHKVNFVDLSSMNGADKLSASDVEILKCLPQELLNDVQAKERKQLHDIQSGLEKTRRRQLMIAGLPKLFNMVRLLFQSGNRTVLTRKDLIKMVLSSHPDIADQDEIMEQLQLLVDFAPEWISANRSSTGDLIYRINKNANMRAVSKALVEAK